jgi:type IV secretion system protein VirB11
MTASQRVYLDAFLAPLSEALARSDVTDLFINRPGELLLRTATGVERQEIGALDDAALWRLARQIAASSDQGINREHPLLAATLPDGSRVQVCAPPATRGHVAVAIRKHNMPDLRLTDYAASGAFESVGDGVRAREATDAALASMLSAGNIADFLATAVVARKTIIISGGTGTGKTTFLNAVLKEAPVDERLVLIEDTPEVQLKHQNLVGLVAARGRLGEACVSCGDLLEAALRLRPDRIIMGEVRGSEAFSWLRAVGSGHPGSITTVHANSPEGAIEQMAMMSLLAGTEIKRSEVVDYIRRTVDIVVQLGHQGGKHLVTDVRFRDAVTRMF